MGQVDVAATEKTSGVDQQGTQDPNSQQNVPDSMPDADKDDDMSISAKCGLLARILSGVSVLADNSDLTSLRGNNIFKAKNLHAVTDLRGNTLLIGVVANASIDSLNGVDGNIIICGMSIKKVENFTHGNLVVYKGNIGDVDGFKGNLRVIKGRITGNVSNSTGNIRTSP